MKFNPINRIRFLTKFRQEPYLSLKKLLGFIPKQIELYEMAFTHRSLPFKNEKGELINNERLEFLGDAILNSIVSDVLYHKYPDEKEGFLTNARSNIVKRSTLNKISKQIKLDELIIADNQTNLLKTANIYGNTLEALVGAVYLDYGYKRCTRFVKEKLLISPESMMNLAEDNDNYKSELLEWCQHRRYSLDFKLLSDVVDSKNRHTFKSEVLINNIAVCSGNGASKRASEQHASKKALKKIRQKQIDFSEKEKVE